MKIKNNLNFCEHGVEEFVLEALTADPTAEIGRKYLRVGSDNHNNRERVFTGGAWKDVAYLDDLENISLDEYLTREEWYNFTARLGGAATKDVATSVGSDNEDLVTSGAVYNALLDYVTTDVLSDYVTASVLEDYVTKDSFSISDIDEAWPILSDSTSLVTERCVYYGLPNINGAHDYDSNTDIYAPTSEGTNGQFLKSSGSGAPSWVDASSINAGSADALSTHVEIWGQSFDGSEDISGALTGVTTITASGGVSIGGELHVAFASHLCNIIPKTSEQYDIGTSWIKWNRLFVNQGYFYELLTARGGITIPDTATFKIGDVTFTVSGNTVTCDGNFCTTGTNSSLLEVEQEQESE